jgi:hypothetical protein
MISVRSGRGLTPRDATLWSAYVALSVYFTWSLLVSGTNLGISDWDPLMLFHANVFRSLYEYGQLPFWNAWSCGGNPLWQNPQAALISPVYVLALAMPLPVAMKLNVLVHYLIGFAGMHVLLVGVFRIAFRPALLMLASLFVLAGGMALHLAVGHVSFLPYFYAPWLLYWFLTALETGALRFAVASAATLAVGLYAGGIHLTFMTAVALGCLSVAAAAVRRDWRPIAIVGLTGGLSVLFASPKLVPVGLFITDPRLVDIRFVRSNDVMSGDMLLNAFLDPFQYLRQGFSGQNYGWHEYGNYISSFGVLLVAAAFVAIVTDRPWQRQHWLGTSLAATTLVLFLLTIGEYGPYAPYELLRRLPLAGEFRVPSRYTLLFALFATSMVAWVARGPRDPIQVRSSLGRAVTILLILAPCYLAYRNRIMFEAAFSLAPAEGTFRFLSRPPVPAIDMDTDGFGPDSPMMRATMRGQAVLRCNDPLQLPGTVRPDQPVVFSDSAQISRISFSPNRIEFGAVTREGGPIYLNERYVTGWRGSAGDLAVDPASGLAYMTLPPGAAGKFTFQFVPRGIWAGVLLLATGLALATWLRRYSIGGDLMPMPAAAAGPADAYSRSDA